MIEASYDIPVALVFFIRPEKLREVFNVVKKIRPKQLFLIQDGPRNGNSEDVNKIEECRRIVEDIDWQCQVYKNYSEDNLGCGVRPYTGISWVFEHVDRTIVLEDDCIPNESFFKYCKEMLERYEKDKRIGIISGLNYCEEYSFGETSYGFAKTGSIWGWATWRDRWEKYDYRLELVKNDQIIKNLYYEIGSPSIAKRHIQVWKKARRMIESSNKVTFWDYQWEFTRYINSWLAIVPQYNLIKNIGVGEGANHSAGSVRHLPKKVAKIFFMKQKELEFPLKHPEYVIADGEYDREYYKISCPGLAIKIARKAMKIIKTRLHK